MSLSGVIRMTIDRVSFSVVTEPVGVRNTSEERETLIRGKEYSFREIVNLIKRFRAYYISDGSHGVELATDSVICPYYNVPLSLVLCPDNRRSARYLRKAWQYVNKGLL